MDIYSRPYDINITTDVEIIFEMLIWILFAVLMTKWFKPILMKLHLNWRKILCLQIAGYLVMIYSSFISVPFLLELIIFDEIGMIGRYGEFMGYTFYRHGPFVSCYYLDFALAWLLLIAIPALHSWNMKISYFIIPLTIFITPIFLIFIFFFALFCDY